MILKGKNPKLDLLRSGPYTWPVFGTDGQPINEVNNDTNDQHNKLYILLEEEDIINN